MKIRCRAVFLLGLFCACASVQAQQSLEGAGKGASDGEYYFLVFPKDKRLPRMSPDEGTAAKDYAYRVQPSGQKPFIFHNGAKEEQQKNKVVIMDPPPKVLFDGHDIMVVTEIAVKLNELDAPGLAIQPAIYIDHNNKWHENYWFLTFTEGFDCWDRTRSTYEHSPVPDTNPPEYEVSRYSLDEVRLQKTPLAERRLFKMNGSTEEMIVVHQSVVELFKVPGVDVVPLGDYVRK